jgi:hypothetical protein
VLTSSLETAETIPPTDAAEHTESTLESAPTESFAPDQDPAGGIKLSGRDRMVARARVLAGMALASGLVAMLNPADTTSSMHLHN